MVIKQWDILKYLFQISLQIQKELADPNGIICFLDKAYIQVKIVFKSEQQLEESIRYLRDNLPQLYNKYARVDDNYYIVFDKQLQIDAQVIYHKCDAPDLTEYRQNYQIIDINRTAEIHIFNNNTMLLLLSHGNCDGGYVKKLLMLMSQQQKQQICLITQEYQIFKEELKIYNQKLNNNEYKLKYENKFDVIDTQEGQKLFISVVKLNMQEYPQLQHKLSWKLIIVNSLYKLYTLQKQNKLQNIDKLLNDGIAIVQPYVVDARRYMKEKFDVGCYVLSINENYLLIGDKNIKTYCNEFQKSFEERSANYEQYGFLQMFLDGLNQKKTAPNTKVIQGNVFSNVGVINNDNYLDCELDLSTQIRNVNQVNSFSYTFNNQAQFRFHCPEEYRNYNVEKIVSILLKNIDDDITVKQLWDLIKNE